MGTAQTDSSLLGRLERASIQLGETDESKAVRSAIELINAIHAELRGKEWDSDTAQAIANRLQNEGLEISEPE